MKITVFDKCSLIWSVYYVLPMFGSIKKIASLLLRPLDAPRYVEFAYLQKFLRKHKMHNAEILDISSPYIMSYILSKENKVTKTDIDASEKRFIKNSSNLSFKLEDATKLSFSEGVYDLVYSVSVIEHIYGAYAKAVEEMIRVTKTGGYAYLTFPVSKEYREEWADGHVYEKQHKENGKTFFQYRFDEEHATAIVDAASKNGAEILHRDIFWERKDGMYNKLIHAIKNENKNKYLNFLKNAAVNFWYGFLLFGGDPSTTFAKATSCGNMHVILRKK